VALVAVTIGGLVVLRVQGLSAGGMNLYPSAAPVLVAVPAAIIVLRGYPAVARELARIAGRSRGVVAFIGLARATRASPGAVLPAFALVLALAMVTFAAMVSAAVTRGQLDASWRQVGADAIVEAQAGYPITAVRQHQIASVPGVTGTATGVVCEGLLLATGSELTAVFVRPASYAAVVDEAAGTRFPLAALSGNGVGRPGGIIPAVATPAAAQLVGSAPAQLSLFGTTQNLTMRLAGRISRVPGIAGGPVVVMPLQALGQNPPEPNLMLVAGPRLDGKRLSAIVGRELPGGAVTVRATALAALTGAPVPRAAQVTLVQAAVTAAGFGVLVLLLSLVLGARSRDLTLARLATMGLGHRQAQLLLAVEALPQVAAAAIGGIACALALAPLVGPAIDLSVFTGPGPSVLVAPDPVALVTSAAGLILAALLALAAQAAITYRRGSTGALRITE
jgi:putative ABC transport system permease protein